MSAEQNAPTITPVASRTSKLDVKDFEKGDPNRESMAPTVVADEDRYLTGSRLFLVFVGMLMSILLIALDQTIVSRSLCSISVRRLAYFYRLQPLSLSSRVNSMRLTK